MVKRELAIKNCFHSWIIKDISIFRSVFADNAVYIESWGPAYRNIKQITAWFTDWNRENYVLKWDIKEFFHIDDTCICEWYFECKCDGNVDGFNGVSIITFDEQDKIVLLKEFQSKTPNNYPYGNLHDIHLRLERPDDYYIVEELTREAFWKTFWEHDQQICDEHLLVSRLRKSSSFVPELSYVAEQDGKLVGHIIYTVSKIVDNNSHEMLTFGPLSVHPDYQNQGIGKALMLHTFQEAKRLGYRAVIIFGHSDYYPRVGFRRAIEFGITSSDNETFDSLMVYPLYDGALDGIQGRYYIDPIYETLNQEDALAFDKQFPAKEECVPISINVLLDRLELDARRAIQQLDFKTLNAMKMKSQREISELEGIDIKALETIRKVMLEHGSRWGIKLGEK